MLLIPAANILLEVQQFEVMPFVLMGLVMVALIFFLRMQVRHTKQIKSELNLLKSLEKHNVEYEFVLGVMRLSIWHLDTTTGQLTFEQDFREKGNKYFSNVDGTTFQETIMALDSRDADRVNQALIDLCAGRRSSYHEMYRVKVPYDNSVYWEESYATVADRNADGKPTKIIGTTMSIDDRKAMEEALVQARNRAEESDRLKTAFIANMSHEIRTPLNAIVGFTSLLPDITDDAERQGLLDLVNENTQKLLRIVDDVVSISKIESGQEQLVMTTFDLNNLLIEAMNYFTSKVNPNVEMKQSFAQESLTITTDMIRLSTIAKHLVSNATKFTTQGIIEVGYDQPQDGRVVIWVRDTGKGIAEADRERIFKFFTKVDDFSEGLGLGLPLTRRHVENLGGKFWLDPDYHDGCRFIFEFPL